MQDDMTRDTAGSQHIRISTLLIAFIVVASMALFATGCHPSMDSSPGSGTEFEDEVSEEEMAVEGGAPSATPAPEASQSSDLSALQAEVAAIVSRYDPSGANVGVTVELLGSRAGTFDINGQSRFVSASTVKLAILGTVLEKVSSGSLSLDRSLTATSADVVGGTGTGISAGQTKTLRDLLSTMISNSDNTASNMILSDIGMGAVNDYAGRAGLAQTSMGRRFMESNAAGENYTSSNDVAKVLSLIATGSLGNAELSQMARTFLLAQYDKDGLAQGITGGYSLGNKTGTLGNARNDAGIIFDGSMQPVAVVAVMTNNMSAGSANAMMAEIASAVSKAL